MIDKKSIVKRLDAVAELKDNAICREEIREYLNPVYDLERLVGKITYQSANPRDLIAFQSSLSMLPSVKCILKDMESDLLKEIYEELDPLEELCDLVGRAIQEEPPLAMKEGGIIKDGYNEEVDRLRKAKSEGRTGLLIWRPRNGKRPGLKTCGSVIIKYSVIIWKLPIRSKIWFRIIIQESRPLPMRSVISFQN